MAEFNQPIYGSVTRRLVAAAIDVFLMAFTIVIFSLIMGVSKSLEMSTYASMDVITSLVQVFSTFDDQVYYTINVLVFGDYLNVPLAFIIWSIWVVLSSIFESSESQATPGKYIMKLKVADYSYGRITFMRAFARNYCKLFSDLFLGIGYLMILITKRKQTLHDIMAGCVVLKDENRRI